MLLRRVLPLLKQQQQHHHQLRTSQQYLSSKACTAIFTAAAIPPNVGSGVSNSRRIIPARAAVHCIRAQPSWLPPSSFSSPSTSLASSSIRRLSASTSLKESYEYIIVERRFPTESSTAGGGVGVITLHRPKALNALCDALFEDLIHAARALNDDDEIGCLVLTGSTKAFAAGADIEEMSKRQFATVYKKNMFAQWAEITQISKPIIAAINGFALGGGCELAMMCDILLAGTNAKFGQPEINLGVIPGAGGTQRLARAIGKSKTMEMVLTGNRIGAEQAERAGLVSRVIDTDILVEEAIKMGFGIAEKGGVAVRMAKEAVNVSDEMTLSEGLRFERRMFHSLFATKDQKEGMSAFLEKRKPNFSNE